MIIVRDTQTMEDPNEFGEALREYCFVPDKYGNDFGCYSTFEARPEFKPCSETEKETLLSILIEWSWFEPHDSERPTCLTDGNIYMVWFWDGDGILLFKEGDRVVINDDCKKMYGWKWVV